MEIIKLENVTKSYGDKIALDKVNLTLTNNKIIGLLGSNGSGKTTIIKLLNGLLTPTSGKVLVNNQAVGIESKKKISYLPENTYLNLNLTVIDIISYFDDFYEDFDKNKVLSILFKFDISTLDKLKTMSKGTKEKVQLALVMSRDADIYILDEPIGGVDPASRDLIIDTILSNLKDGATLLISTHLISEIETILDEVIFISKGKIILHQDTDSLRLEHNKSIDSIFREEFKCY